MLLIYHASSKEEEEKEEKKGRRGEGKLGEGEEEEGKREGKEKKKQKRKERRKKMKEVEEEGEDYSVSLKSKSSIWTLDFFFSNSSNIYGLRFYVSVIIKITKKLQKQNITSYLYGHINHSLW